MSKKNKHNKQNGNFDRNQHVRDIIQNATKGKDEQQVSKQADVLSVEPAPVQQSQENLPNDDSRILELTEQLKAKEKELGNVRNEMAEKEKHYQENLQAKVNEQISKMGIDIPATQEKAKDILSNAEIEKEKVLSEAKRQSQEIKSKAESEKKDADSQLSLITERQKQVDSASEDIAKQRIQLETDKASYKKELGDQISKEFKDQISKIDTFEAEKAKSDRQIEYLQNANNELKAADADRKNAQRDLEEANHEIEMKDNDYKRLDGKRTELEGEVEKLKEQLADIGGDPLIYKRRFENLEADYEKLKDRMANVPGEIELSELRRKADEYEKLVSQYEQQAKELADASSKNTEASIKASQVDDYIKYVKILSESKRQLQEELASLQEQYESENNTKFKALTAIDQESMKRHPYPFSGSLYEFCQNFLGFAQNEEKPLFYKEETIYTFMAWLASTKTMILEGLSGTGKTSLPLVFQRFAGWYTPRISVQSAWKDRNDLVGFFNDFKKEYKETEFLKALYSADRDFDCPALIVLDEMNLSRIEYYFADFLSALESPREDDRVIDLLSDQTSNAGMPKLFLNGGKLPIGKNIWFIGTANKDDSTFDITDKVYDRAGVIHFADRGMMDKKRDEASSVYMSYSNMIKLFETAKRSTIKAESDVGKKFKELEDTLTLFMSSFEINIGNRIMNQLEVFVPVYLACANDVTVERLQQAVDCFFPFKVLRKLEGQYDAKTKKNIDEFIDGIQNYHLPKTKAYLENLRSKID